MHAVSAPPRRARRLVLILSGSGLLAAALTLSAHVLLASWAKNQLHQMTGLPVQVRSVDIGWRAVTARDVAIFGAAPFSAEPLVRIERLLVTLGGAPGYPWWRPSSVLADGVEVQYLRAGSVDNLRGNAHLQAPKPGQSSGDKRPSLSVRRGRLTVLIQPSGTAPRITIRAREFSADRQADAHPVAVLQGVVVDAAQVASLSIPMLTAQWPGGAENSAVSVTAHAATVSIPGGGPFLRNLDLQGRWSPSDSELSVSQEIPGTDGVGGPPSLRLVAHVDPESVVVDVRAARQALSPMHTWLGRVGVDSTRATGSLDFHTAFDPTTRQIPFDLAIDVRGADIHAAGLDRLPWRAVPVSTHLRGNVDFAAGRLLVQTGSVEILGVPLDLSGWTDLGSLPRGSWHLATPKHVAVPCADLLAKQPEQVQKALRGLQLGGTLGLTASFTYDAANWEALTLDAQVTPRCQVLAEPEVLGDALATFLRGSAPNDPTARARPLGAYHRDFAGAGTMPPHLRAAFVTAEDAHFYQHRGFDLEMIRRALAFDIQVKSFARGASTITQQVAKNLFLTPDRTLTRKLEEIVLAWRLDERLGKAKTLELYLNLVELGPGIHGVKQASKYYFGKPISQLRPIESAHLAALTPNPQGFARRFRDGHVDEGWLLRLYDLLGMMKRSGRLSPGELAQARSARLMLRKI